MPLEVTQQQARIWQDIKSGRFRNYPVSTFRQNPESLKKDQDIKKMLRDNIPVKQIKRDLGTGDNRINRVLREMSDEAV